MEIFICVSPDEKDLLGFHALILNEIVTIYTLVAEHN